jgi:hypothetical protein
VLLIVEDAAAREDVKAQCLESSFTGDRQAPLEARHGIRWPNLVRRAIGLYLQEQPAACVGHLGITMSFWAPFGGPGKFGAALGELTGLVAVWCSHGL